MTSICFVRLSANTGVDREAVKAVHAITPLGGSLCTNLFAEQCILRYSLETPKSRKQGKRHLVVKMPDIVEKLAAGETFQGRNSEPKKITGYGQEILGQVLHTSVFR